MADFGVPTGGVTMSSELVLRAATAAYLGRYRGQSRPHGESDLRFFLRWCADEALDLGRETVLGALGPASFLSIKRR
jgi:integrase/recombinase XerD